MASRYNFSINKGATKVIELTYTDSNNQPKDLTGYNARMQLRKTPTSQDFDLELLSGTATPNSSILGMTPSEGKIRIYISAVDSDLLTSSVYFYDLELYTENDPFGKNDPEFVIRVIEGTISVKFNITR